MGFVTALGESGCLPPKLGRYELITRIGHGGMAEVQLALQRGPAGFEKLVVVKLVHANLASQKPFVDMLLDEARVAALVKHPNVVDIYDLGEVDGRYFIAMEYLEGEPLLSVLRAGRSGKRLDALSTARLIADTAEGLDAAHELRSIAGEPLELVHHDVSLGNIVVLYNGQVKLVDFGVAKASQNATTRTTVQGKFGYMAPEKLRGGAGDRRSDIWSLGCVLWESLTLRRLFRGDSDSDTMHQVLDSPILAPSRVNSDVPSDFDPITLRALARDPKLRYPTAKAMAADLEDALRKHNYAAKNDQIARYMQATFANHIAARKKLLQEVSSKGRPSQDVLDAAFNLDAIASASQSLVTAERWIERPSGEANAAQEPGAASRSLAAGSVRLSGETRDAVVRAARAAAATPLVAPPVAVDPPDDDPPVGPATLRESTLGDSTLGEAMLGESTLGDSTLGGTTLDGAMLGESTLGGATLGDSTLGDSTLGDSTVRDRSEIAVAESPRRWIAYLLAAIAAAAVTVLVSALLVRRPVRTARPASFADPTLPVTPQPSAAPLPAAAAVGDAAATAELIELEMDPAPGVDDPARPDADPAAPSGPGAADPPRRHGGRDRGVRSDDPRTATEPNNRPSRSRRGTASRVQPSKLSDKATPDEIIKEALQVWVRGDGRTALALCRRTVLANPGFAPAWRLMGLVYERLGEKPGARGAFEKYLQYSPGAPDAAKIRAKLESL